MAAKVFVLLCLSLLLFQSFAQENSETDQTENPEWLRFWHPHPHPGVHPPLPAAGVHPPLPVRGWQWHWLPHPRLRLPFLPHPHHKQHSAHETFTTEKNEAKNGNSKPTWPFPSWLPKTKWPFPHPPFPSWLPKTKRPFPSWGVPKTKWPFPSWLPKTKRPFPHPPLPSWWPKNNGWHFPALPPLPSGGCKWPWLPHHDTKTLKDLESKCHSTPAAVENCMKEGTYSFTHTNGYAFSAECCKSIAEIKDECSDALYVPLIKYQCSSSRP